MKKRILLTSQQNDIFKYINNAGLNHDEFQWLSVKSSFSPYVDVLKLIHKQTKYYFKFDIKNGQPTTEYFPSKVGSTYTKTWPSWEPQLNDFISWLDLIMNDLETPNLWETSLNASKIFEPTADEDLTNELFTFEDQKYISAKLYEIEKYLIESQNLSSENLDFIREKIIYLEECSKRIGKKDWLNIVIGTSFKIAVGIGLSSAIAKDFFRLVGTAFGHFLSVPVLLP